MEYYVHHVPGRLRVRIPAIRKNPKKAEAIQCLLSIEGIDNLKVNHLTGSVVVTFDSAVITSGQLLELLKANGYYDNERAVTCDEKIMRASSFAADKVGRAVIGYALGKALEAGGLSLLAALIKFRPEPENYNSATVSPTVYTWRTVSLLIALCDLYSLSSFHHPTPKPVHFYRWKWPH